jgi:hypothetical protein
MPPTLFIPHRPILSPFRTMGDDEFFPPRLPLHHLQLTPPQNPLTPDELTAFAQATQHHVHAVLVRRPGEHPGELGT